MSKKRRLGEGDDVPSIAAAAITVTLSSEGSKAVPTYSGCSADAPPQSVAQEMEPEPAVPGSEDAAVLLQAFREAIQGVLLLLPAAAPAGLTAAPARLPFKHGCGVEQRRGQVRGAHPSFNALHP